MEKKPYTPKFVADHIKAKDRLLSVVPEFIVTVGVISIIYYLDMLDDNFDTEIILTSGSTIVIALVFDIVRNLTKFRAFKLPENVIISEFNRFLSSVENTSFQQVISFLEESASKYEVDIAMVQDALASTGSVSAHFSLEELSDLTKEFLNIANKMKKNPFAIKKKLVDARTLADKIGIDYTEFLQAVHAALEQQRDE
jgi:hypothetical protein